MSYLLPKQQLRDQKRGPRVGLIRPDCEWRPEIKISAGATKSRFKEGGHVRGLAYKISSSWENKD